MKKVNNKKETLQKIKEESRLITYKNLLKFKLRTMKFPSEEFNFGPSFELNEEQIQYISKKIDKSYSLKEAKKNFDIWKKYYKNSN